MLAFVSGGLLLWLAAGTAVVGAQAPPVPVEPIEGRVAAALEFVTATFPELKRKDVYVLVASYGEGLTEGYPRYPRPFEESFWIHVAESRDELLDRSTDPARLARRLFVASFRYNANVLSQVSLRGRVVEPQTTTALRDRFASDARASAPKRMTPEQKRNELAAAGIAFGPAEREAFRAQLPLKTLEALFGPSRVVRTEFDVDYPSWRAEVERAEDGAVFLVTCDPFTRRIQGIVRLLR